MLIQGSFLFSLASAVCLFVAFCFAWQKFCKLPAPWLKQLDSLGRPRKGLLSGTAIVCGGSTAGIVAARICADHFERVIIIDPEIEDPEKPKTRIMQYNAGHVFLCLFVEGARRLWPNFDSEMNAAGGRQIIFQVLLKLLMQHPTSWKVTRLAGTVKGVRASRDGSSIDSVTVRRLDGSHLSLGDVALVVDCTGTTQAGLKWLKPAGFDIPPKLAVKLPIPATQLKTMFVYGYVPHDEALSSSFALIDTDNNMFQLVLTDCSGRSLPRTAADVVPFITAFQGCTIPIPSWVIEAIGLLCEHGNPSFDSIKIPESNPWTRIFEGSVEWNGAKFSSPHCGLEFWHPKDFSVRYFKNSAASMNALWNGTRLHDYGAPSCIPMEGETKDTGRFMRWFERKLISAAAQDEEVASALWHVRQMFAADRLLLAPTILWKVIRARSLF
ncbi:hypothetical protein K438DRAFT_1778616 [Mycena galopus ATCC 62051]|nr:hypothetical protein K438DRAFT_1778616 [Mycena galopus ATCC 62051]